MPQLISPYIPFPNLYWWSIAIESESVVFDKAEHFQKMSYRNRYYITGSNGFILLSIPLQKGRNQRTAMRDVKIDYESKWQQQHWRSIYSAYGNSPYFEHYAPPIEALFKKEFAHLIDFCKASIDLIAGFIGASLKHAITDTYRAEYTGSVDLRTSLKPGIERKPVSDMMYYQVFADKNGFHPNLSILDLLFAEGPATKQILSENKGRITDWVDRG